MAPLTKPKRKPDYTKVRVSCRLHLRRRCVHCGREVTRHLSVVKSLLTPTGEYTPRDIALAEAMRELNELHARVHARPICYRCHTAGKE